MTRRCGLCGTEYSDDAAFCGNDGEPTIQVTPPGETPDPRLGGRVGEYVVVAHVADGAMGAVYEGRHTTNRSRVAIKILHPDVVSDDVAVERFNREYETAAMFDHPHIVKVIDFGETADGFPYLTMEYLVGHELGTLLRTQGKQPPSRVLRMLAQVALGLEHAHAFGVVHRDLKPENIFLCEAEGGDHVRLLDFGSVKRDVELGPKLTAFGTTLGSPCYMSPEQAKGLLDVDARTDVFAMGAILYECLTGKMAFDAPTIAEILTKIVREMPPPATSLAAELPPAIDDVIARAIAKDKAVRFETPSALVEAALAAFSVSGTCAEWASRTEAELRAALSAAASATRHARVDPGRTPPSPIPEARSRAIGPEASSLPPDRAGGSRLALLAGLAVLGVLVASGIAVALLHLVL